jgi:hypothetical protein
VCLLEGFTGRELHNLDTVAKEKAIRERIERLVAAAIEEHRQEAAAVAALVNEARAA